MKVMINTEVEPEHLQRIQLVSDDIQIVQPQDNETQLKEVVDTDVILGGSSPSLFENARQLKWDQHSVQALTVCFFLSCRKRCHPDKTKGFVGPHLADQTWALTLAYSEVLVGCSRTDLGTGCPFVKRRGNLKDVRLDRRLAHGN